MSWRTLQSLMVIYTFSPNPVRRNVSIAEFGIVYCGSVLASFSCPLAHSISFCPAVAYAVPIPLPQGSGISLILDSLSSNITDPLLSSMRTLPNHSLRWHVGEIFTPLCKRVRTVNMPIEHGFVQSLFHGVVNQQPRPLSLLSRPRSERTGRIIPPDQSISDCSATILASYCHASKPARRLRGRVPHSCNGYVH
jgi:hypothetical protein